MIRNIFLILETALFILFLIPVFSGIINPGNAAGMLVSLILISVTFFFERFKTLITNLFQTTGGKITVIGISLIIVSAFAYVAVLSGLMISSCTKSPEKAKAVVVLGCKVNGETPSRMLTRRLESACEFLTENENSICIVSGGKGDDEKISEALAMQRYLLDKGIEKDRIIMEDKSTNTDENLKYSSEILKSLDISEAAIVTDSFHQYRASYIAKKYNLVTSAINAKNDFFTRPLIPTYWVREWMAITKEYIF